ncbi:MAG: Cyclic 2,3-diphosphoglycerate synthetase [Actinobacteria bacterium]|nr:Cyclic 2,3-diphosphoglycerate synthetase [Actinomycetota bacterium]
MKDKTRLVALIDGEHYPPVIKSALEKLKGEEQVELVGLIFLGGTEKISSEHGVEELGLPLFFIQDLRQDLERAIDLFRPEEAVDLSDEPVVGYRERMFIASVFLARGVVYRGADFIFQPPRFEQVLQKPSLSIIGTGKRIGKTAVSAYAARILKDSGFRICVIAMGRGGPEEPEIIEGDRLEITPDFLLSLSRSGRHASSDHVEDALVSGVLTVGCRRCGGGLAGVPFVSNVLEGARLANRLESDFLVFEGSGAALPLIHTDFRICVVGANQPLDYIGGYFGTYRVLISDAIVVTMCEEPLADSHKVRRIDEIARGLKPEIKIIHTIFRPNPLQTIEGRRILFTSTSNPSMGGIIKSYLEEKFGCRVIKISHALSERPRLLEDLTGCEGRYDLILTELKAASVDVVTEFAARRGVEVVYCDNVPVTVGGDGHLSDLISEMAREAKRRFGQQDNL